MSSLEPTNAFAALARRVFGSAMLFGSLTTLVRIGGNILLVPLLVVQLTKPELALWWVFWALGEISALADFGFGQSITRAYNYLWAGAKDFAARGLSSTVESEPNRAGVVTVNAAVRPLYWGLSLGATVLMGIGAAFFVAPLVQKSASPQWMWAAWLMYMATIAYGLGSSHWMLACQGVNRVRELQAASLGSGLAYLLVAAAGLVAGWGLMAMVIAAGARAIVNQFFLRRAFVAAVSPERLVRPKLDRNILRKLWPNTWRFGLLALGAYLIQNGSVLICARLLPEAVTADFGLTTQIGRFGASLASLWLLVKWPHLTILRAQGQLDEMGSLFARRLGLVMFTLFGFAVFTALAGNQILDWKGSNARLLPFWPLVVYFVYLAQQVVYVQFAHLKFSENVVPFWLVSVVTGVALTAASIYLARLWGVWGLVIAPLITTVTCSCWYVVWRSFPSQPLPLGRFLKTALSARP